MAKRVKLILKKSLIGRSKQQRSAVHCLGLKKIGQSVVLDDNPIIQGQINKVRHLLSQELVINSKKEKA